MTLTFEIDLFKTIFTPIKTIFTPRPLQINNEGEVQLIIYYDTEFRAIIIEYNSSILNYAIPYYIWLDELALDNTIVPKIINIIYRPDFNKKNKIKLYYRLGNINYVAESKGVNFKKKQIRSFRCKKIKRD